MGGPDLEEIVRQQQDGFRDPAVAQESYRVESLDLWETYASVEIVRSLRSGSPVLGGGWVQVARESFVLRRTVGDWRIFHHEIY